MTIEKLENKRLEFVAKARKCDSLDTWELYDQQVKHYTNRIAKLKSLS